MPQERSSMFKKNLRGEISLGFLQEEGSSQIMFQNLLLMRSFSLFNMALKEL